MAVNGTLHCSSGSFLFSCVAEGVIDKTQFSNVAGPSVTGRGEYFAFLGIICSMRKGNC